MVQHSRSMAGMDGMDMGLGPIESFAGDLGRDDGSDALNREVTATLGLRRMLTTSCALPYEVI